MKDEEDIVNRIRPLRATRRGTVAFSLFELLLVVFIIGVLVLVTIPILRGIERISVKKTQRNAQQTAQISSNLSSLDVVHVLPESLGGAEATTRLIKQGLHIEDGSMDGVYLGFPNLGESEVQPASEYLEVVFDGTSLRLEYNSSTKSD